MRLPIQYAVLYPDRMEGKTAELSLFDYPTLSFERPDRETFRCLDMAFFAMEKKQNYSVIMNAANEVAVESFLSEKIGYLDIPDIIQAAFENVAKHDINTYADVTESDKAARAFVREMIAKGLR
jgi:1-deoxy-D-xylulose-5-phosphate reductoisomerase